MDSQYVVELRCSPAEGSGLEGEASFHEMLGNSASWWNWLLKEERFSAQSFLETEPGRKFSQEIMVGDLPCTLSYRMLPSSTHLCALIKVVKPLSLGSPVTMSVFLTIIQQRGEDFAHCRIEMGRDTDGLIVPSNLTLLRRPAIIASLIRNTRLRYHTSATGSLVDGKAVFIPSSDFLEPILEALPMRRRLPLLLLSQMPGDSEHHFPNKVANELTGLAQVLTVPSHLAPLAQQAIRRMCSEITLPTGAATLIWPDPNSVRYHPIFPAPLGSRTIGELMRILGPISVTASGRDWMRERGSSAWERDQRRVKEEQLRSKLTELQEASGKSAEMEDMQEQWMGYIQETEDALALSEKRAQELEQELNSLKARLHYERSQPDSPASEDLLDSAPSLDPSELDNLADFLTRRTDEALVFTASALRSWSKSTYSDVDDMRKSLCLLAQAAREYAELEGKLPLIADDWFSTRHHLHLSSTDGGLKKRKLDRFSFEGREYSRLPHLKLNDRDNFEQIGRIYFAFDSENKRLIVDHVGNKLYDPYTNRR